MNDQLVQQLTQLAIAELPSAISLIKDLFVQQNPSEPVPTDDEVTAAYQAALASSLAKDAQWLAAHPTDS
jgi:hypothetical protein